MYVRGSKNLSLFWYRELKIFIAHLLNTHISIVKAGSVGVMHTYDRSFANHLNNI